MKVKNEKVRNTTVYVVLRFLVIVSAAFQILDGNWDNVFGCVLTLLLFTIPTIIDRKTVIKLPNLLESLIYLFIFSATILGEIQNFYGRIEHWDTILHTINGFLFAGIGFSLIDILNKSEKVKVLLSPMYVAIMAFCFSTTIGTMWEIYEYAMDEIILLDMQKDDLIQDIETVYLHPEGENITVNINDITSTTIIYDGGKEIIIEGGYLDVGLKDTMKDIIVNAVGAVIFSIIGFLYIHDSDQYEFAKHFIPTKKKKK